MAATASSPTSSLAALSNDLAAAVEHAAPSVVAVDARSRIPASGVLWRPGVVVATNHTIKRDEEITVALDGGAPTAATLAGRDATTDLAVLTFQSSTARSASLGDGAAPRVGNLVLALGRPAASGVSASFGVVSAVGASWRTWGGGQVDQFIRLDIAIYDGFSGGPLVSAEGKVIGVNSSGMVRGAAMTIPVSTVDRVVDALLAKGRIARAYLGLGMQPVRLPPQLRDKLHLPGETAVIVLNVEPDAPADRAGVLIGDVLVALDHAAVRDTNDVLAALGPDRVDATITARVVRGGEALDIPIALTERPRKEG